MRHIGEQIMILEDITCYALYAAVNLYLCFYLYLYSFVFVLLYMLLYLLVNSFSKAVIPLTAASKIGCMDTLRDYGIQKRDLFKPFRRERNEQKTL